ncbi:hypothetical protein A3Q37_03952 [Streptomyces sp. PTY087I2]|nr:hypothetical protein A3Q37_03952 [Streptomyces sp. PTY087I2]
MHPEHPGVILQGEIMDIPYIVIDQLTPDQQQVWKTYFGDADRPRYIEEGIWRRTQEKATAEQSGWTAADDARRRIIHISLPVRPGPHHRRVGHRPDRPVPLPLRYRSSG